MIKRKEAGKLLRQRLKNVLTSMRFLILLCMTLLVALPILAFDLTFVRTYPEDILNQRCEEVQKEAQKLSLKVTGWMDTGEFLMHPQQRSDYKRQVELLKASTNIFDSVQVVNSEREVIADNANYSLRMLVVSGEVTKALSGRLNVSVNRERKVISAYMPVVNTKNSDRVEGVLLATYPIDTTLKNIDRVQSFIRTIEWAIFSLSILLVFGLSIILTSPYKRISKQIGELSTGLADEMDVTTFYETRLISEAFNRLMKKQLREDELKQEFVSNVSHELRTPITSMKVLAESLVQQEDVPNEIYREFMNDIVAEIDREDRIISDLLSLVRIEKTDDLPEPVETSINQLVHTLIKRLQPIADKREISIAFDERDEVIAKVDEVKLSLAFSNLIENAVKYNRDGGWVKLYLNADPQYFYFKVSDNGIGIPEEAQEDIFQRFYRVDKARSSSTGGTGLGLSITRSIIIRHKGVIKVYSDGETGTTFTVRIPLQNV